MKPQPVALTMSTPRRVHLSAALTFVLVGCNPQTVQTSPEIEGTFKVNGTVQQGVRVLAGHVPEGDDPCEGLRLAATTDEHGRFHIPAVTHTTYFSCISPAKATGTVICFSHDAKIIAGPLLVALKGERKTYQLWCQIPIRPTGHFDEVCYPYDIYSIGVPA